MTKLDVIFLAVFLILFGIFSVTNLEVVWGRPIMGFSALIAGGLLVYRVVRWKDK